LNSQSWIEYFFSRTQARAHPNYLDPRPGTSHKYSGQSCLLFFNRFYSKVGRSRGNQSQSRVPGPTRPGPGPPKKSDFGLSENANQSLLILLVIFFQLTPDPSPRVFVLLPFYMPVTGTVRNTQQEKGSLFRPTLHICTVPPPSPITIAKDDKFT
jgi:hypothetical protein